MKVVLPVLAIALLIWGISPCLAGVISGQVSYEDKIYDPDGFTGQTQFLPVRYATLIVAVGEEIFSTQTDGSGNYSVLVPDRGIQKVYISVYAQQDSSSFNIVVKNNPTSDAIYVVSSPQQELDTNLSHQIDLEIPIESAAGAFNIFDMGVYSYQFLGIYQSPLPDPLPKLTFYWEAGSTTGTAFNPSENAIYLLGKSSDPDEFDDDIILHEVGHFVSFNFSKDENPGGAHSITGQYDPRLTWSEGWGHFWSCSVRNFAGPSRYQSPNIIVDNFASGASSFDVEAPSFSSYAIMATNELAVVAVLWDIFDPANDDPLEVDFSIIWQVLSQDIPLESQITLEDFFKGWRNRVDALTLSYTQKIFYARSIKYFSDKNELNDSPSSATLLVEVISENTFFPSADLDWFKFDCTSGDKVVIETANLGDGCDTVLTLYGPDGASVLAINDDISQFEKASRIEYVIPQDGTYFVKANSYDGADRITEFGFYDIRLCITSAGNLLPEISLSSSISAGTAPLRVDFVLSGFDQDGYIMRYEWDFDGDGIFELSSPLAKQICFTYQLAGSFNATARVIDNMGAVSYKSIPITVMEPSREVQIEILTTVSGNVAPVIASFSAQINGIKPALYEWDFDADGIIDFASSKKTDAQFIYSFAGTYTPRLLVTDQEGVSYTKEDAPLVIYPGQSPPTINSFNITPQEGKLPLEVKLSAEVVDDGEILEYRWDVEGDGTIDLITNSPQITFRYTKAGLFKPTLYVIDDTYLGAKASSMVKTYCEELACWILYPPAKSRVYPGKITIVAEIYPPGKEKTILFQYREEAQPYWNDIGEAIKSGGIFFKTLWEPAGIKDPKPIYLRALVNGKDSTEPLRIILTSSDYEIKEEITGEGLFKIQYRFKPSQKNIIKNWKDVELILFADQTNLENSCLLSIQELLHPSFHPYGAGNLLPTQKSFLLSSEEDIEPLKTCILRLPFSNINFKGLVDENLDPTTLQVFEWDQAGSKWERKTSPLINLSEGYIQVKVSSPEGEFAIFGSSIKRIEGKEKRLCTLRIVSDELPWNSYILSIILILGVLLVIKKIRSSISLS